MALVTLYADSLHSVMPEYSADTYKLVGLLMYVPSASSYAYVAPHSVICSSLIPTALMPLSLLSYASILGIVSTLYLVLVMFIDGFSKPEGVGSLWTPAETSLSFSSLGHLGLSFGLFMAGVSCFLLDSMSEIVAETRKL